MGWYAFIPFMECYHGVVSANHYTEGYANYKGQKINFNGGKGYIEKDRGISFPESWIWLQANTFADRDVSFFFSVAKIPWLGSSFPGFLCFVYINGNYYRFMT